MVTECRTVPGDRASIYPARLDRHAPGEVDRIGYDLSNDADCRNAGVTVTNVVWSISPVETPTPLATLSAEVIDGLEISVLVTINADPTDRTYTLLAVVTLSDQRVLHFSSFFPVVAERAVAA